MKWIMCFLIGLIVSIIGFCNNLAVENLAGIKFVITSNMMLQRRFGNTHFPLCLFSGKVIKKKGENNGYDIMWVFDRFSMAFLVFFSANFGLTLFASLITALIAPAASGSGIPEVKAYLNGVDAPGIFSWRTLLVKVLIFFLLFFLLLCPSFPVIYFNLFC